MNQAFFRFHLDDDLFNDARMKSHHDELIDAIIAASFSFKNFLC